METGGLVRGMQLVLVKKLKKKIKSMLTPDINSKVLMCPPLFTSVWYGFIFPGRGLVLLDRAPSTPLSTCKACSRARTIRLEGCGQAFRRRFARDLGSSCNNLNLRALPSGVSGISFRNMKKSSVRPLKVYK